MDSDFNSLLTAKRRNDIVTGIREQLMSLLSFTHSFLLQCAREMLQSNAVITFNDAAAASPLVHLIEATLSMLIPLISVAKPEEMCAENFDFSILTLDLLKLSPGNDITHFS